MFGPAKAGIAVVSALIVVSLISPLAVFLIELSENPYEFIKINITSIEQLEGGRAEVTVEVTYGGSVPLADFTLRFLSKTAEFGDITKGVYSKTMVVSIEDLSSGVLSNMEISFKVAGLYYLKIRVGDVRYPRL